MSGLFERDRNYVLGDPELEVIGDREKLAQWRHKGIGPAFYRLGRKIVYRGADLNAWAASRRVEPGKPANALMARRVNAARVKANRSYTVEELADTAGVTPQTVRSWIKQGLPALTEQRPFLVLGWALQGVCGARELGPQAPAAASASSSASGASAPAVPRMGMADYEPLSPGRGLLRAFCEVCEGTCTRVISAASLPAWRAICQIGGNNPEQD